MLENIMTKVMKTMVDRMRSSNKIFTEFEDKRLKFKKVQYRKVNFSWRWFRCYSKVWGQAIFTLPPLALLGLYHGPHGPGSGANESWLVKYT